MRRTLLVPGWRMRAAVAIVLTIALAGCATVQHVGGWFGGATPTPTPAPSARVKSAAAPRVYFAGTEGLKLYSEPSASAKVVGTLSLHEKVTRTKLEHGFAYVESAKTGLKGWVTNAQLIWRLPTGPTTTAPAATEPETEAPEAPAAAEEPQAPEAPEATAPAAEQPPTPTPAPAVPAKPQPTPAGVAPSIFNPY